MSSTSEKIPGHGNYKYFNCAHETWTCEEMSIVKVPRMAEPFLVFLRKLHIG